MCGVDGAGPVRAYSISEFCAHPSFVPFIYIPCASLPQPAGIHRFDVGANSLARECRFSQTFKLPTITYNGTKGSSSIDYFYTAYACTV